MGQYRSPGEPSHVWCPSPLFQNASGPPDLKHFLERWEGKSGHRVPRDSGKNLLNSKQEYFTIEIMWVKEAGFLAQLSQVLRNYRVCKRYHISGLCYQKWQILLRPIYAIQLLVTNTNNTKQKKRLSATKDSLPNWRLFPSCKSL